MTAPAAAPSLWTRIPLGLRYMAASALFFSVMSLFVKLAGQRLPSMQIVLARYLVMAAATWVMMRRAGVSPAGTDRRSLVGRAGFGFVALSLFYFAIPRLPLGDVTAIQFTSPVWTALVAGVALKERTGPVVWVGIAASLVGVVFIARPSFLFGEARLDGVAVLAASASAVLSAVAYTFVRKLRQTDDALVVIWWFSWVGLLATLPFVLTGFLWPTPAEWLFLAVVGLATQFAQVALTRGLHLEQAGRATSVGYLQIVFAFGWGALVFGDLPTGLSVLGVATILGSVALVSLKRGV